MKLRKLKLLYGKYKLMLKIKIDRKLPNLMLLLGNKFKVNVNKLYSSGEISQRVKAC